MTSKERILGTLAFEGVDRIPTDVWVLPAARIAHGNQLQALHTQFETDICSVVGPFDHGFSSEYYTPGQFTDPWGSEWTNIQAGIIGEVKKPVFARIEKLEGYVSPKVQFQREFDAERANIAKQIIQHRQKDKFIIGGWISIFERLQYLRGTEDLYCDIALEQDSVSAIIALVMDFMHAYLDAWLAMDIDAVAFGDDWGSQINLLISPDQWVSLFKPLYSELIQRIKAAGKKVFFHSDGYIFDLYPHFIEMGVDAINSQLWCMGVEKVAAAFAGKITFWGEISRQTILPYGTPQQVQEAADLMIKHLFINGGGLIGQSEIGRDVPFENVQALYSAWNKNSMD